MLNTHPLHAKSRLAQLQLANRPPSSALRPPISPRRRPLQAAPRVAANSAAGYAAAGQQQQASENGGGQPGGSGAVHEPPRPKELLGLQHMLPMGTHLARGGTFEGLLRQWQQELGPCFEFQVPGSPPVMIISDPEAIKQVFEVYQWAKSPRYMDLLPILGPDSMLITEGHEWRQQRDAFNPGFSATFLRAALSGFVECSQHLVERLETKADRGEVVLMHHAAVLTTLEIICKVGFGEDVRMVNADIASARMFTSFEAIGRHVAWFLDNPPFNFLKSAPWNVARSQRLQQEFDEQLVPILFKRLQEMGIELSAEQQRELLARSRKGSEAIYKTGRHAAHGSSSSSSSSGGGAKCPFPGVTTSSSTDAVAGGSDAVAGSSDATTTTSSSSSSSECPFHASSSSSADGNADAAPTAAAVPTDILSMAVNLARWQQQESGADDAGFALALLSQMKTFFAAGHDTTAGLIGWTMWFLSTHPEVEAKLVDEILGVMGPDSQPSYQQLSEMRYLNAVLKESLRVRPPVGVLARWAPDGTSLAGFNTSNKVILVSPLLQHMSESAWGPDAAEWRPERWMEEGGRAQSVSQYSYLPFSRGPRDCIGSRFALLEAKTILAMIYRKFEFEYAGTMPEEVLMSVTAHPKYGVPLCVKRRQERQQQQQAAPAQQQAAEAARARW